MFSLDMKNPVFPTKLRCYSIPPTLVFLLELVLMIQNFSILKIKMTAFGNFPHSHI